MITAKNIENLRKLVSKYALEDYKRYNPHPHLTKNGYTHNPYTLSPRTEEARDMLHLAFKPEPTKEDEERIKAYLLNKLLKGEIEE